MSQEEWAEHVEHGRLFHVSSTLNRESIRSHGLDWTRMGVAPGIAGSDRPEVDGCFLALDDDEAEYFARRINNTGGPVDVWLVLGIDPRSLRASRHGYRYYPQPIQPSMLSLFRSDVEADETWTRSGA
jgi:hypothetical protein